MSKCIRRKCKHHKGRSYEYYELVETFRDPDDKSRVISKFLAHLGKKEHVRKNLERLKREAAGRFSVERIMELVERESKKADSFPHYNDMRRNERAG